MTDRSTVQYLVNVSTMSIHATTHPIVSARPAYTLSKMAGTLLFQIIAQDIPPEKMQVISFHPGLIWNDQWKSMGLSSEQLDTGESPTQWSQKCDLRS